MKLHLVPQNQNNSQKWTLNQTNSHNWILNQTNSQNWILNQSNCQSGKKTKIQVGPSVFVIHQKCLHIIHWDSQPSVVSRLVQTLYLDGVIQLSSRPGCYLRISIIHRSVMGLWCILPICRWCTLDAQRFIYFIGLLWTLLLNGLCLNQQWNLQSFVLPCLLNRQSSNLVIQELWLCYFSWTRMSLNMYFSTFCLSTIAEVGPDQPT